MRFLKDEGLTLKDVARPLSDPHPLSDPRPGNGPRPENG